MNSPQPKSWNELFVLHSESAWNSLYRFSLSLCKNESEAEDLVQQTLLKALQALPAFFLGNYSADTFEAALSAVQRQGHPEFNQHLLNWMLKICKNTFLDSQSRASRRYGHMSLEDWQEDVDSAGGSTGAETLLRSSMQADASTLNEAEREFYDQALDDDWKERFDQLNPRQRSVIYLAAEDYSYKEIAQLLEIPIGTVMSTLSRTLSKLKK